ncbi:MAG: rhomboid family intramembrane serine protease [Magnetovibrionaceae bacterium]
MPIIPLHDKNPLKKIRFQYVNLALILTCVAVFLWQLGSPDMNREIYALGTIPAVLNGSRVLEADLYLVPAWASLLTGAFLHAGWLHLGGNMLFLWVFGDNIEDELGHYRYLVFYAVVAVAASLAHVATNWDSILPLVGASGAVSGIMGAYLVLYPKVKVTLLLFKKIPMRLAAWAVIGLWAGYQVFSYVVLDLLASPTEAGGVAWMAHIGGFIAGAVLIPAFRPRP